MKDLRAELERRRQADLYRRRRVTASPQAPEMIVDGRPLLSFCSNDYLGLAADPRLAEAARAGLARYGTGAGAAHLINGHAAAHHALEEELADFTGRPRALLFSTGYMANLGVVSALLGRGDSVLQDRLNHASLLDAGLVSRARQLRYRHADPQSLAQQLARAQGEKLVATDGLFSMDGAIAPLPALARICRENNSWLLVDDAHGLGVLGEQGGGCLEHFGLDADQVPILMGTLGKGLGSAGAFVAGADDLIEFLIQQARSYIYTTAQPPAIAEATRAALRIVRAEGWRREHLMRLIEHLRQGLRQLGLPLMASQTPIQPVLAGSAELALRWSDQLQAAGILLPAIRPPTVPEGSARLRISLSASHTEEQVDRLLAAMAELPRPDLESIETQAEPDAPASRLLGAVA